MNNTINGRTPDEIKKALKCCADANAQCEICTFNIAGLQCISHMADCAYDYIRKLEYHIGELTEKVVQLEAAQSKWISVEERLPDNHGDFLTKIHCEKGDWIEVNTFDHTEKEWWHDTGDRTEEATEFVTHWMPLPELPKELNDNGKIIT